MTPFLLIAAAIALVVVPRLPTWWRRLGDLALAEDTPDSPRRTARRSDRRIRAALAAATRMLN
jgi:hypothetical protein